MPRAFITGITGQDGSYLAELLLDKGYHVHGLVRRDAASDCETIRHLCADPNLFNQRLFLHQTDLRDSLAVRRLIDAVEPSEVYLAAQSNARVSFDVPEQTCDANAAAVLRLLEAIRKSSARPRFFQASSSEMFGKVVESPQSEKTPFQPRSPYGVAKVFAHWMTVNYRETHGLHASNAILFNHDSPRRPDTFVTRKITSAVARIKAGLQEKLMLGNLDARRDWGHAAEFVEAMWRMLQQDRPDDYIIATGETHTIREFVAIAFDHAGLDWRKHVEIDPQLVRPAENDVLVGNATKANTVLGWKPRVRFRQLVQMMVDADLASLEQRPAISPAGEKNRPLPLTRSAASV